MANVRDFVFCADGGYVFPLKVVVLSLLWARRRNDEKIIVHVLDCGIGDNDWCNLLSYWQSFSFCNCEFKRHNIDMKIFNECGAYKGSLATYARLLLPTLLPSVKWCLYSDCDMLFIDDPEPLDDFCVENVACAGHLNPKRYYPIDGVWFAKNNLRYDIDNYLCAGFLLMNLKCMRDADFTNKAIGFLREHPDVPTADQCVINSLCFGETKLLDGAWGVFSCDLTKNKRISCIHYPGQNPWRPYTNWRQIANGGCLMWRSFAAKVGNLKPLLSFGEKIKEFEVRLIWSAFRFVLPIFARLGLLSSRIKGLYQMEIEPNLHCVAVHDARHRLLEGAN